MAWIKTTAEDAVEIVSYVNALNELDMGDLLTFVKHAQESGVNIAYLEPDQVKHLSITTDRGVVVLHRGEGDPAKALERHLDSTKPSGGSE